jgi:hypothetical protein
LLAYPEGIVAVGLQGRLLHDYGGGENGANQIVLPGPVVCA